MVRASRWLAAIGSAVLPALVACTGDDPVPFSGGDTPNGPSRSCKGDTVEACGPSCAACKAPARGGAACVAGACEKTCEAGETVCDDACVSTQGSSAHCGRCHHSCGAGQCSAGVCQPFAFATGFTVVHGIAMSASGVVIAADDALHICGNPEGCVAAGALGTLRSGILELSDVTVAGSDVYSAGRSGDAFVVWRDQVTGDGAPAKVVESVGLDTIGRLIAGPTALYWTRHDNFYGPYSRRCTLPACAAVESVRPEITDGPPYYENPMRELAVRAAHVSVGAVSVLWATGGLYNKDPAKQLRSCTLASTCATPTEIATDAGSVSALTYFDGKHYGAAKAAGSSGNVIFSVDDAAPGERTMLASDAAGTTDIAVDATGIYWSNGTTGEVHRCPKITGCPGSGDTIATGQAGVERIRLDADFVYWMTAGAVFKLAK